MYFKSDARSERVQRRRHSSDSRFPLFGGATYPMEIAHKPEQITIIHELHDDVGRFIDENCLENEKFMRRLRGTP